MTCESSRCYHTNVSLVRTGRLGGRKPAYVVVVRTEDVGRNDAGEVVSVLVVVCVVEHIYQTFAMGVTEIGTVRGAKVDRLLAQGVLHLG